MPRTAARLLAGLVLAAALAAPASRAADGPEPVRITGSGYTMPRFLDPWAEMFAGTTGTPVVVTGTGTATGPPALLRGEADIAAMSRPMNRDELEAFRARVGREPVAIPVAADALAVFVNAGNPLDRIRMAELDAVFSADRRCGRAEPITRWGGLGLDGPWSGRRLTLYGRRPGSGTGALFRELALCGGPFRPDMRINPGGASAALAIAEEPYGIGFGGLTDRIEGMKTLAISAGEGQPFALPSVPADVHSGAYPLSRRLYLYALADGAPLPEPVRGFMIFALSDRAQQGVEEAGFLRLPPDLVAELLASPALAGP